MERKRLLINDKYSININPYGKEYNVVEFATAVYGNDKAGIQLKVEYSTDQGTTWVAAEGVITVETKTLQTYRITLPEGVKRVAIVVVENSGNRVNIDNIKLMK